MSKGMKGFVCDSKYLELNLLQKSNQHSDQKLGVVYLLWPAPNNSLAAIFCTSWNLKTDFKGRPIV